MLVILIILLGDEDFFLASSRSSRSYCYELSKEFCEDHTGRYESQETRITSTVKIYPEGFDKEDVISRVYEDYEKWSLEEKEWGGNKYFSVSDAGTEDITFIIWTSDEKLLSFYLQKDESQFFDGNRTLNEIEISKFLDAYFEEYPSDL